ncbi:MAG: hypothetical protein ABIK73_07165 [candidate division WOR-3 bacterium]
MNPLKLVLSDFIKKDLFRILTTDLVISDGYTANIVSSSSSRHLDSLEKESSDEIFVPSEEEDSIFVDDLDLIKLAQIPFPGESPLFPDIYLRGQINPSQAFSTAAEDFRRRFGNYPNTLLAMFRQHWSFIAPLMRYYVTYKELETMIRYGTGYGGRGFGPQRIVMLRALKEAFGPSLRTINRVFLDVEEKVKQITMFDTAVNNYGLFGAMKRLEGKGISPYKVYVLWRQYRDNLEILRTNPEQKEGQPIVVPYAFNEFETEYSRLEKAYRDIKSFVRLSTYKRELVTDQRVSKALDSLFEVLQKDWFIPSTFFSKEERIVLEQTINERMNRTFNLAERNRLAVIQGLLRMRDDSVGAAVDSRIKAAVNAILEAENALTSGKTDNELATAIVNMYESLRQIAQMDIDLLPSIFGQGREDIFDEVTGQKIAAIYLKVTRAVDKLPIDLSRYRHVRTYLDGYIAATYPDVKFEDVHLDEKVARTIRDEFARRREVERGVIALPQQTEVPKEERQEPKPPERPMEQKQALRLPSGVSPVSTTPSEQLAKTTTPTVTTPSVVTSPQRTTMPLQHIATSPRRTTTSPQQTTQFASVLKEKPQTEFQPKELESSPSYTVARQVI